MLNSEKLGVPQGEREVLTGTKINITINPNAHDILDTLVDAYKNKLPPYDKAILPQGFKPDSFVDGGVNCGSHSHAMYFWNVCSYMSGRTNSDTAFKAMTNIFEENPELFDCYTLAQTEPAKIFNILKKHGLGRQNLVATNWINNAQKLIELYDGDPRNIFDGVDSYKGCVDRIKNSDGNGFAGFREKMTSMILYFFMDEVLIPGVSFPIPVDFHAQRVALATEMVTVEPLNFYKNDNFENALRGLFQDYLSVRQDVNPLDLTNSVWLLSSNFCNKSTGNNSSATRDENGTNFTFPKIESNKRAHSEAWRKSCGRCAVKNICRYYVPSRPYYVKGLITPMEKTITDFVTQLSFLDYSD